MPELRLASPGKDVTSQPSLFLQVRLVLVRIGACFNGSQFVPLPMLGFPTITLMPTSQLPTMNSGSLYTFLGGKIYSVASRFTSFATFLLHNPSFTWLIHTNRLRVTALGTIFDGVSLSKDVTFKAFNGLPGVTISNFELPSDDPAGGIHIETDSLIPSPARLYHLRFCCLQELTRLSRAWY